jgi:beta-glucanase (GH16 family)
MTNHYSFIVILLISSACLWGTGCSSTTYRPDADLSISYELAFSDEFEGDSVDVDRWLFRADNKHQSVQSPDNVSVEDGSLVLTLKVYDKPVKGKKAGGAGIITRDQFHYGYYEVRAKLGDGRDDDNDGIVDEGWHHSFWAMAAEGDEQGFVNTTYPGVRRTEIDCYEYADTYALEGGTLGMKQHVIVWNEDGSEWGRLPKPPKDMTYLPDFDATEWHTYGFEWTEDDLRFFVDGKLTNETKYPASKFVHDQLNIWLTGMSANWCDDDPEPSIAYYDYIRYYKPIGK